MLTSDGEVRTFACKPIVAVRRRPALQARQVDQLTSLSRWLLEYDQLRMPIFGYLFRGSAVRAIERDLNEALRPTRPVLLKREVSTLRDIQRHATAIRMGLAEHEISESFLGHTYALIAYDRVPPPGAEIAQSVIIGLRRLLGTLPTPRVQCPTITRLGGVRY
jgi:hypothetical protein